VDGPQSNYTNSSWIPGVRHNAVAKHPGVPGLETAQPATRAGKHEEKECEGGEEGRVCCILILYFGTTGNNEET